MHIILKWLNTFCRRFFSQQFKRSCLPDGPKVGTVTLSPRGDWRMPSDASAAVWLKEIKYRNGEITREEYDQWRYRYPRSEAERNEATRKAVKEDNNG